ncbi:baculoviral IAP repeat-containing protein 7-A-like [Megalops cyprinoides]|uniref:baculoviral IAP repeat-containing protein 7-A-like n=1 Tax=Megalops cyprinoides TaxID=118141 RepID=UPI001863A904|nr:baculoviral IAP repeat-containing protein 7-A-like [Megalops cyprinoides]
MSGTGSESNENIPDPQPSMPDDRSSPMSILVEPRMWNEEDRQKTFQEWPRDAPVTGVSLAKAGFYYVGPGDKVQCFCCGGILRDWVHGDCPSNEHRRHFPTCGFVRGTSVGNVPRPLTPKATDSVDGQLLSQLQRAAVDDEALAGQAVYPEMEREETRLSSFYNWPTDAAVRPEVLAQAGFCYTGQGDNVKCFYCDGGLRNWEPGDDPWLEHAKWFPRCEFLLKTKGYEYVARVQESQRSAGEKASGGQSAQEQLMQLQQERTCKVCMDKPVSLVFIPCGHLVVCADCAPSLSHCPICRAAIRGSVRAFMS